MAQRKGVERYLFWLYEGFGTGPYLFRWALLALDAASVAFFLWAPFQEHSQSYYILDLSIALFIALDFIARLWIARPRYRFLLNPLNLADIVVLVSLILPMFFNNLAFLRILRAIRLVRAFTFLRRMKNISSYLRQNAEVIDRVVNLAVFILIMTALVYSSQVTKDNGIDTYLDAMYFTIASLTTTGYGDLVLEGAFGKILSMFIMVLGISLFLRLVQALVRPSKVKAECERCGLMRHEPDAVHCKHCGEIVKLPHDGAPHG
ncbi:potassium channel family protein [Ponticaulis profundi]|uniref:Potassium channel family protein n=1 Tax=Ponticaulis profundi TaxID=2665222 RepID=A0ABW1SE03_9PROT